MENQQSNEPLISRDEAIKLLQINPCTLWKLTKSGKITHYRIGRKMFFKKSEIYDSLRVVKTS